VKTHSPLFYVHWALDTGAKAQVAGAIFRARGLCRPGEVDVEGQVVGAGKLLVFAPGKPVLFEATQPSIVMLLGGEPIGERLIEWNFVASSKERMEQAKADWRAGRFKLAAHRQTRSGSRSRRTSRRPPAEPGS